MDARTLEGRGMLWTDRGDTWRRVWLRDGLAGPARFHRSLLVQPDAEPDDRGLSRPWFPDYEEVE